MRQDQEWMTQIEEINRVVTAMIEDESSEDVKNLAELLQQRNQVLKALAEMDEMRTPDHHAYWRQQYALQQRWLTLAEQHRARLALQISKFALARKGANQYQRVADSK